MNIHFLNINTTTPNYKKQGFPIFRGKSKNDVFVKSSSKVVQPNNQNEVQIPEYLYHLTNKNNFKNIIKTGEIIPSEDIIDGVFMFDMKDFQTNWKTHSYDNTAPSIAVSLLLQAIKSDDELVLIKIPTKNLKVNKIKIRPQDDVCRYINSREYRNLCMVHAESGGAFKHKSDFPKNLTKGYKISCAQDFFNENRPIEYVYQGKIKVDPEIIENALKISNITYDTIKSANPEELEPIFYEFELMNY